MPMLMLTLVSGTGPVKVLAIARAKAMAIVRLARIQAYITAVRVVLSRYGPPDSEHVEPTHGKPSVDDDFGGIREDLQDRLKVMQDDPDVRFIIEVSFPTPKSQPWITCYPQKNDVV
eukprot:3937228-Rhodomonas_salina.1